jgi:peptidyl-prolyl cis-trans isomerase-like 4
VTETRWRTRFGTILSCEIIRDKKSGDSLQYAFIEFDKKEEAEAVSFAPPINVILREKRNGR